jgi:hypothetical protein
MWLTKSAEWQKNGLSEFPFLPFGGPKVARGMLTCAPHLAHVVVNLSGPTQKV